MTEISDALTPGDIAAAHIAAFLDARTSYANSIGHLARYMVPNVITRQLQDGTPIQLRPGQTFSVMVDEGVPLLDSDLRALLAEREQLLNDLDAPIGRALLHAADQLNRLDEDEDGQQ